MGDDQRASIGEGKEVTLPIVLREEAEIEFDEAFDWYESKREGLGREFVLEVQKAFDQLAINPGLQPKSFREIRKKVIRRFPYCIFFILHEDRLEVLAIFHTSRDPAIWLSRA